MGEFNPDEFINQNLGAPTPGPVPAPTPPPQEEQPVSGFDPDQFIAQNQGDDSGNEEFDPDEFIKQDNEKKYGHGLQQAGAFAEGYAQGFAGPVASAAEFGLDKIGVPGFSKEDIAGRAAANPVLHGIGEAAGFGTGLLTGTGEAGLVAKIAGKFTPEAASILGRAGAGAINSAIQSGLFQTGNEITDAFLDQGNPEHPVAAAMANVGAASLFGAGAGAILGGASGASGKFSKYLQSLNLGQKANEFTTGFGLGSIGSAEDVAKYLSSDASAASKNGLKTYQMLQNKISQRIAEGAGVSALVNALPVGNDTWYERAGKDVAGFAAGAILGPKIFPKIGAAVGRVLAPTILKLVGTATPERMENSINYVLKAAQGQNKITNGINSLFNYGVSKAVEHENPAENIDFLKNIISTGKFNMTNETDEDGPPQGFAKGGHVEQMPGSESGGLAVHFPTQNVLLHAAKARIGNYLKAAEPKSLSNNLLPFASDHKDPNAVRQYDRVLHLANNPLSVLNHVKDGSLLPQHVKAMNAMFPELHKQLSKGMLEKIAEKSHKKDPPSYKMRQALSLFLGQDLDGSLNPGSIQAAQAVFMKQNMQKQASQKDGSLSKTGNQTMTAEQSRTRDLNK